MTGHLDPVEGSWFELWHPLQGRSLPSVSDLAARSDPHAAAVWRAAGRLAAARERRVADVEAARAALHDATWEDPERWTRRAPPSVRPVDLFRSILAVAPGVVRGALGTPKLAAFGSPGLDALLALGAAHLAAAASEPLETLETLEVPWARRFALALAEPGPPLTVPDLLVALESGDRRPLVGALECSLLTLLELDHLLVSDLGATLELPPCGPVWLGPGGLLGALDAALADAPGVVIVGGDRAESLADIVQERARLRGEAHAGPFYVWIGHPHGAPEDAVRFAEPGRLLRLGGPGRRIHRRLLEARARWGDWTTVEPGEKLVLVVGEADLPVLHAALPGAAAWPRIDVPPLPETSVLLQILCQKPAFDMGEAILSDAEHLAMGLRATRRQRDADARLPRDLAIAEARRWAGRDRHAGGHAVPLPLLAYARGERKGRISPALEAEIAATVGTLADLAVTLRYVEGLPGETVPEWRARRA